MNTRLELEILEPMILLSADAVLDPAAAACGDSLLGEEVRPETVTVIPSGFQGEDVTPDTPSPQDYQPEAQLPGLFDGLNEISTEAPSPAPVESEPEPGETKGPGSESTSGRSSEVRELTSLPPEKSTKQGTQSESTLFDSENAARSITEELVETLHAANAPPAEAETSLVIQQDEELTGNHSLAINLVNHGVVSPGNSPGIDNVSTFNQGPDGTTVIEIGGTDGPGVDPSGHDQINVSGLAELDGTLELQLINGFTPSAGDTFTIFTWGSRAGEFANYLGTAGIPGSPDLAIQPIYNASDLTLEVVQTPTIIPGAESTIDDGLDSLAQIGDALDSAGEFAESIPFIGETLGDLVDAGTAINDVLRQELTDLLGSVTRQSEVTAGIEDLNGTTVAGFTLQVNGVLGHYGTVDTDPFWWDVDLAIIPGAVNHAFEAGSQTVLGAAFNPDPQVQVNSRLNLDFAFGLDSGFFVELEALAGQAEVDTSGLSGFDVDLAPSGGAVSLSVTDGSIELDASVTATPDASILTGGRITAGTLSDIADGTINAGDAFNLDEAGSIDAALTLDGTLSGFAFDFTGTHTTRIQSTELFSGQDPDLTLEIDGTLVVAGQTLNGVFSLKKTATETLIEASDVSLELQAGAGGSAQRVLEATNGSGTFLILDDELAGTASLSLGNGPAHANLDLTGTTLNLVFNSSDETVETIGGTTVDLPAGPFYRVSGTAVITLTDPEAELSGDFTFEPFDPTPAMSGSGDEIVTVGVADLSFEFDDGTGPLLEVSDGSGAFVFTEE
jgi:hypothetical protein